MALINSIKQIKEINNQIKISIADYHKRLKEQGADMDVGQYGQESEYSLRGIIGGVKDINTDISYLVNAHNFFIQCSTLAERNSILGDLTNLNTFILNSNHQNIVSYLDALKTKVRVYALRRDKDRFVEFSNEINNIRIIATKLEEEIDKTQAKLELSDEKLKEIIRKKENFDEELSQIENTKDVFLGTLEEFTGKYEDFKILAETAISNESIISSKLTEIKESEEIFNDFISKIESREKQLSKQKEQTDKYNQDLKAYTDDYTKKTSEVEKLIENALIALEYSTAEGISTAFQTQYKEANKPENKRYWLIGAFFFILLTFGLGIWIVGGWGMENTDRLYTLIGRLSLIPFTLLGALFCANQYVKQKNLIEDYAYKAVLSKSIVAFSENLRDNDPEKYAEYISIVLREIHQDPLRKRGKDKDDEITIKDSTGIVNKVVKEVIALMNKNQ